MVRFTATLAVIFSLVLLSHAQRLPDTGGDASAVAFRHQQDDGDLAVAAPIPLEEGPRAVGSGISAVAEFRDPKEDGDLTSIPVRFIEEHGVADPTSPASYPIPSAAAAPATRAAIAIALSRLRISRAICGSASSVTLPTSRSATSRMTAIWQSPSRSRSKKDHAPVGSGISAVAEFGDPKEDGDRMSIPVRFIEEHGDVGSDVSRFVSQTLRPRRPCHKGRHRDRAVALDDFPRNLPERLAGDGGYRGWMPREGPLKVFRGHEEKKGKMFGKHEDTDGERFPKHHHHHHRREGKQEGGIGRWFRQFLQEQI